jgi:hypothetical protein
MHRFRKGIAAVAAGAIVFGCVLQRSSAQSATDAALTSPAEPSALLAAAQAEEKLGTHAFYTQSYIDQENKWASYEGSVFGGLMGLKVDGCELKLDVELQDIFTGTVGKKQTGRQVDTYKYTVSFTLTREMADNLALEVAPPSLLGANTHSVCAERRSCSFEWLVLRAPTPIIWESRVLNGFLDVNAATDRFQVPVSTAERGAALIAGIKALAADRCP